ncbi:hypothetical protein JKP88DRAFT_288787 [Tribonema minus]|uniref:Uncharacterized protein n=1 Tax=Tribonema minus TaxID=303371 RepID=A0A835Z5F3_9STRA|nr:hypothetical protein JKP88DRAFT_288787 [Tribonema minus]
MHDPVARAARLIAAVVGLFGIFLLDPLALMLATWLFLCPLEKMGRRVAQGQRVDVGYLRSLSRRRFSWAPIALVSAASLGVGVFVGLGGADERDAESLRQATAAARAPPAATAAVRRRSADGPGSAVLAWRYGIDGTGRFAASTQGSTTLRNVLAHVDDDAYADEGRMRMAHVGEMMQMDNKKSGADGGARARTRASSCCSSAQTTPNSPFPPHGALFTLRRTRASATSDPTRSSGIVNKTLVDDDVCAEFAVLVNKTLQVVAAPNCPELQGMVWDPASLVSDTIKTGLRYTRSALVRTSELELFKAPVFADKLVATTPTSALHPSMASAPGFESVIRWQSTPIWTAGPGSPGPPDGAMLFGSIANGKTRIPEMANRVARQGYSAVYYYDSNGQYQLASSVLLQPDGTLAVDIPLASTDWLDALRTDADWLTNGLAAVTAEQDVGGRRHVVSAHCQTKNTQINAEGGWDVLTEWDGAPTRDCWVFLVQGLPWAAVSGAVDAARGWQVRQVEVEVEVEWDGAPTRDCWVFLVQGLPWAAVSRAVDVARGWQVHRIEVEPTRDCWVFLVQGLPWAAVSRALEAARGWQGLQWAAVSGVVDAARGWQGGLPWAAVQPSVTCAVPTAQRHEGAGAARTPLACRHIDGRPFCLAREHRQPCQVKYFFIAVCVAKLAAMWALCYRAYRPFSKIVFNRFVQNARIVDAPESPVPSPRGAEVGTPARPALRQTLSKTSMSNTAVDQSPA